VLLYQLFRCLQVFAIEKEVIKLDFLLIFVPVSSNRKNRLEEEKFPQQFRMVSQVLKNYVALDYYKSRSNVKHAVFHREIGKSHFMVTLRANCT
jgi:hypothetical protein